MDVFMGLGGLGVSVCAFVRLIGLTFYEVRITIELTYYRMLC